MNTRKSQIFCLAIFVLLILMPAYALAETVATPSFTPAGGTYTSQQLVRIATATAGATIRYTTDGTAPSASSKRYLAPILVTSTTTIQAQAFKGGLTDSAVASATYTIKLTVATPTFQPGGGTYTSAQNVRIQSATAGAAIHYTTDGTAPTASSKKYENPIPVAVTTTIKALATKSGQTDSAAATGTYTINLTVATPTFKPQPGTYTTPQKVTISSSTAGATIRYTTDGSNPTAASKAYTAPVPVTATTTFKARAFKAGFADSAVATGAYTIVQTVATPTFSPKGGIYASGQVVSITSATSGATIRYTVDSSNPNASSKTYTAPISVTATTTLRAKAFKTGMADSAVATAVYVIGPAKVVLLLHDMSAGPEVWNEFVQGATLAATAAGAAPPIAPTIYAGVIKGGEQAVMDRKGVFYYRLKFGSKDAASGRVGAEKSSVPAGKEGDSGDFSAFADLAKEVGDAVTCLLNTYSSAQVVLIGHGRGGLAARAFLQTAASSKEKSAVVALVTIGTPHSGTPLGRIFMYLKNTPRLSTAWGIPLGGDWQVVDVLRGVGAHSPFVIDLRRPTIDDQSTDSTAVDELRKTVANLPKTIAYGTQAYDKIPLGKLSLTGANLFFEGPPSIPAFSANARDAVFRGTPADSFIGDGIVPLSSQTFEAPALTILRKINASGRVVHAAEPAQTADLRALLEALVPWWK